MDDTDRRHLARCVDLAERALATDNDPFGSVLVDAGGTVLWEGHNETAGGDETRHPEFEIARWAAANMTPEARAAATVYTSGEHCPMCAAAHGWVGLGRVVYALSGKQFAAYRASLGADPGPVAALSINEVAPTIPVEGPEPGLEARLKDLHRRRFAATQ